MNKPIDSKTDMFVLVLGASSQDIVGRLEVDLQPGTSNPARIRVSYGGVARNVAENLARLGQPVKLISVVGKDRPGDELLEYTAAAGVDVSAVLRTDLYPTGFYMGALDPRARLRFAVDDMRVMSELTPEIFDANSYSSRSNRPSSRTDCRIHSAKDLRNLGYNLAVQKSTGSGLDLPNFVEKLWNLKFLTMLP